MIKKKKKLSQLFEKDSRTDEDLNEVLILIKKNNIINDCYKKAEHFIDMASNSLSIFPDSKYKNILNNLTSFSLSRDF